MRSRLLAALLTVGLIGNVYTADRDRLLNALDAVWGAYYSIVGPSQQIWLVWRFPIRIIRLTSAPETVNHEIAAEWLHEGAPLWMVNFADPTYLN